MELQTVFDFKDNHGKKDNHLCLSITSHYDFFSLKKRHTWASLLKRHP